MSEQEKARAAMLLSILVLTLTALSLSSGGSEQAGARTVEPVVPCASTDGAICDVTEDTHERSASPAITSVEEVPHLGEMVVSATRLPAPLGHLVVSASRLPQEPYPAARLAEASTREVE